MHGNNKSDEEILFAARSGVGHDDRGHGERPQTIDARKIRQSPARRTHTTARHLRSVVDPWMCRCLHRPS